MKPRIFIGSSREGYSIAEVIKNELSDFAECQLWDEGFFEPNKSSFESLSEASVLFDFAILLASGEDLQLKRGTIEKIARDNVVFEFGLYIGRLGRNRSFFIKEKNLDLPSDLYGITLNEYKKETTEAGLTINDVCKVLKLKIQEIWSTYELSFIPSTVLATGYFENFLLNVCRELKQQAKREVDGRIFKNFYLHIIIPDELPNNFQDRIIAYLDGKNLKEMKVETVTRKYNFYLDYSEKESEILELYDLPTTLSALKKSIEMAIPKSYIGETLKEQILKKKEMNNFCRTLEYLVNENAITRNNVKIEFIDIDN